MDTKGHAIKLWNENNVSEWRNWQSWDSGNIGYTRPRKEIHTRWMKYTNNKNNISEILKVYIINSTCITMSYILNIKTRPLVTEYVLTIKLVGGTNSAHSFNPYAYFSHSWSYVDIQNLRLVVQILSFQICFNFAVQLSSRRLKF